MHFIAISLALAPLFYTTRAAGGGQVTIWSEAGCTGNSQVVEINADTEYCFEGIGGQSWNNFKLGTHDAFVGPTLTTWSGSNCAGSSAVYEWDTQGNNWGCVDVPFASCELQATYE